MNRTQIQALLLHLHAVDNYLAEQNGNEAVYSLAKQNSEFISLVADSVVHRTRSRVMRDFHDEKQEQPEKG